MRLIELNENLLSRAKGLVKGSLYDATIELWHSAKENVYDEKITLSKLADMIVHRFQGEITREQLLDKFEQDFPHWYKGYEKNGRLGE